MRILLATGCGEEPGPEDLLTLVELDSNPAPPDSTLVARARVSFRDWFNGGLVIEKRVGSTALVTGLAALLEGTEEEQAEAWALVMAGSASAGLAEQLVVGYQGLIRDIGSSCRAGRSPMTRPPRLLVAYLADIEEIEIDGQPDSLVITPLWAGSGDPERCGRPRHARESMSQHGRRITRGAAIAAALLAAALIAVAVAPAERRPTIWGAPRGDRPCEHPETMGRESSCATSRSTPSSSAPDSTGPMCSTASKAGSRSAGSRSRAR